MEDQTKENQKVVYDVKQVLVVRGDLNMRKGKMMAMAAHASVAALLNQGVMTIDQGGYRFAFNQPMDVDMLNWMAGPFAKIALRVDSLEEMDAIYDKAKEAGLITSYIVDNGNTEFRLEPTAVSIAIGPAKSELIDPITRHLKLW